MADRLSGKPIHLDISDLPMKKGITTNRNKFILGPSGSGKSFFTNHMVRRADHSITPCFNTSMSISEMSIARRWRKEKSR